MPQGTTRRQLSGTLRKAIKPTLGGVVDFTTMLSIAVHLKKAAGPMLSMPAGKVMVGNAVHFVKARSGISVRASESLTDVKLLQ